MKQVKVKITFRCVELRTIWRTVDAKQLARHNKAGDTAEWLEVLFRDDLMADCDISTESFDIDSYDDEAGKET